MLYVHRKSVLVVLLVDAERFLVPTTIDGNLRNLVNIAIFELVNVINGLALSARMAGVHRSAGSCLSRERRRFDDDLLEEFDGEISRDEGLDGDRYIVGVGALW